MSFPKYFAVLLVLPYQNVLSEDKEFCEAAGGQNGTCVPLPSCPEYLALLDESTTAEEGLHIALTHTCGADGVNVKVCCPHTENLNLYTHSQLTSAETNENDYVDKFPSYCGISMGTRDNCTYEEGLLLHGKPAYMGISRWVALLGYKDDPGVWKCAGSIITQRHVLTAAHCIKESLFVVRLGEINLDEKQRFLSDPQPIDIYVKRKIRHENYYQFHNDIGLVILAKDIQFAEHIHPVCLPFPSYKRWNIETENYGTVTGWGKTETGKASPHLLYASMKLYDNDDCRKLYKNVTIDERVICAGEDKTDACEGDSGGPLVWKYCVEPNEHDPEYYGFWPGKDKYFQLGIVSYGFSCDKSKFKGVYTNVTHFIPWIEENVLGKPKDKMITSPKTKNQTTI